jgi:hypothetical protein
MKLKLNKLTEPTTIRIPRAKARWTKARKTEAKRTKARTLEGLLKRLTELATR